MASQISSFGRIMLQIILLGLFLHFFGLPAIERFQARKVIDECYIHILQGLVVLCPDPCVNTRDFDYSPVVTTGQSDIALFYYRAIGQSSGPMPWEDSIH